METYGNCYPFEEEEILRQYPRSISELTSTCSEWCTLVDLEGCYPQEVTAKVNTKSCVLLIKAKSCGQTSRHFPVSKEEMFLQSGKVVRILPLPENIHIQKLRVNILPTGEVIVKAPFLQSTESILRQKMTLRSLPLWVPIPVIRKDTTYFNKQKIFGQQRFPNTFSPLSCIQHIQGEDSLDWMTKKLGKKTTSRGHCFPVLSSTLGSIFRPDIIRDEITGKLAMLLKVNTIGFQPEDVRVRVDESQNTLIVEAVNKRMSSGLFTSGQLVECSKEELLQQGLPVKYLRREFILPHNVDVSHIGFRVKESGLLVVKVPLMKSTEGIFSTEHNIRGIDNVETMMGQVYPNKWMKPLSI